MHLSLWSNIDFLTAKGMKTLMWANLMTVVFLTSSRKHKFATAIVFIRHRCFDSCLFSPTEATQFCYSSHYMRQWHLAASKLCDKRPVGGRLIGCDRSLAMLVAYIYRHIYRYRLSDGLSELGTKIVITYYMEYGIFFYIT